jgi:hypothetical protein
MAQDPSQESKKKEIQKTGIVAENITAGGTITARTSAIYNLEYL